MASKFRQLSMRWQVVMMIIIALVLATAANLIMDGGAAAHDLLYPEHGWLFK